MNCLLRAAAALLVPLLIAGCATPGMGTTEGGIPVVTTHTAKGQDSRALFLVIHYTVADLPQSLVAEHLNDLQSREWAMFREARQ